MSLKEEPRGESKNQVLRALNGVPPKANIPPISCADEQSMAFIKEEPEELPSQDGKVNRNHSHFVGCKS